MAQKNGSGRTKGANRKTSAGGRFVVYASLPAEDEQRLERFGQAKAAEGIVPKTGTLAAILIRMGLAAWERSQSSAA